MKQFVKFGNVRCNSIGAAIDLFGTALYKAKVGEYFGHIFDEKSSVLDRKIMLDLFKYHPDAGLLIKKAVPNFFGVARDEETGSRYFYAAFGFRTKLIIDYPSCVENAFSLYLADKGIWGAVDI